MASEAATAHRRPASLALRVTMMVGIATTAVFLAFSWIVARSMEQHFAEQDAGELRAVADAVIGKLAQGVVAGEEEQLRRELAAIAIGHHGIAYGVFDEQGRTVFKGPGPDLSRIVTQSKPVQSISADSLLVWRDQGKSYRGVVLSTSGGADPGTFPYRVGVAMDIDFHVEFLHGFDHMLWVSTVVLASIALLAAWLAVQWGHRPIRKVNKDIQAIRSSRLDARLNPLDVPIELQELADSFNDMLGRIEDGFAKLSNFSADIAHELRTPVTNLTTQTQVALSQSRSREEYREALYSNLEEFERMSRMIGDMLFLAQTENDPHNLRLTQVHLDELIRGLFDYFEALAEDAGITLRMIGSATPIQADRDMVMRAVSNLMSNAIRYSPRGSAVTVRLQQDEHSTHIGVENSGTKIPENHLPKLFDRFYRVDPARQWKNAGSGLGLAIVKTIAEAHGGEVHASSTEARTRFDLVLPHLF